ncbi:glycosyl hydrolase [bacterium]|nr:glycosyl hydrolase [bacterium]
MATCRVHPASFDTPVGEDAVRKHSWVTRQDQPGQNIEDIHIAINTDLSFQTIEGIGGAFNENGGEALEHLSEDERREILQNLFDPKEGAGFSFCRVPIGSSDFAFDAYSHNDHPDDFQMEHFSLQRDKRHLIPYIKSAQTWNPRLRLFASPWSPPAWLKTNYSFVEGGSLIDTPQTYQAYALYMRRFVEEYLTEGISIDRIIIQNEPDSAANFPSCVMPPEQMVRFTVEYLAPAFHEAGIRTGLWGGTFRTITGLQSHRCMADARFREVVEGNGFQYSYPGPISDLQRLYPNTKVMHTESVCYGGDNTAAQAVTLFYDFMNYLNAGCVVYCYWNMVLNETAKSSWGWKQNSLITVNRDSGEVTYNPDYATMQLLSRHIRPGARRIESFCFVKSVIAFQNTDGTVVAFLWNDGETKHAIIELDGVAVQANLPGRSLIAVSI